MSSKKGFYFSLILLLVSGNFSLRAYSFTKLTILTHFHTENRGPDAVVRSLEAGLREFNINFNKNPAHDDEIGDAVIVLSGVENLQRIIDLKKTGKIKLLLAGPNLMIRPNEHNRILTSSEIDQVVVPSDWVRIAYTQQEPSLADHIATWYAGVNTDQWAPSKVKKTDSKKVLVYWKTESESFCCDVENALREYGFDPIRLCYGTHNQEQFKRALDEVRFAVFISKSESQGIALAEAWSMDVPTINWDPQFLEAHGRIYSECSSCPYLTPSTGLRWQTIDEFKNILCNIDAYTFSPRLWVIGNMSDRASAKVMLDIIAKAEQKPSIIFHQSKETLEKISEIITNKQTGAYLRFGDGDVNLVIGSNDMLQDANSKLSAEMREAFGMNGSTILKALPLHCEEFGGLESGMFPGNHEWPYDACVNFVRTVSPLWQDELRDVYSQVALHYLAVYDPNLCIRFLKFLRSQNCVFVGNENVPQSIRKLLFGERCQFVPAPSRQSYTQIDRIEQECLQVLTSSNEYKVVVIAMGCSGRVLQKRLLQQVDNVFLFDFGSLLDALCEWDTRAWISLSKFNANQFLARMRQGIRVLATTALLDNQYEQRKSEYEKGIEVVNSFGYEPYIVEAITASGPTFLDDLSDTVFYSNVNDASLRNKGVNEARSMRAALEHFGFSDDDMIIKVTGRYRYNSDYFIRCVEDHPDIDCVVCKDEYGQVRTCCFALRCKYFKEMLKQLDLEKMEREMINIELEVASYLKRNIHIKVFEVPKIDMTCRIAQNNYETIF